MTWDEYINDTLRDDCRADRLDEDSGDWAQRQQDLGDAHNPIEGDNDEGMVQDEDS